MQIGCKSPGRSVPDLNLLKLKTLEMFALSKFDTGCADIYRAVASAGAFEEEAIGTRIQVPREGSSKQVR